MRAAQPDEQPSINRAASILTPAQEKEMRRMDLNGDGIIDEKEQRAIARSTAGLRGSKSMYQKGFIAIFVLLILSWISNAGFMVAIVNLSKDLKVDGVALKTTKGGSVSTHGQKDVYEITLTVSGRRLDEEGHSDVATVTCMNVLQAISSLEDGEDEALVEIVAEDGGIWEPRFRAAAHYYHEESFSMEQIQLDDRDDKLYDVTCDLSKESCMADPDTVCDVHDITEVVYLGMNSTTFEDAFDGDAPTGRRRRLDSQIKNHHCHTFQVAAHVPCDQISRLKRIAKVTCWKRYASVDVCSCLIERTTCHGEYRIEDRDDSGTGSVTDSAAQSATPQKGVK